MKTTTESKIKKLEEKRNNLLRTAKSIKHEINIIKLLDGFKFNCFSDFEKEYSGHFFDESSMRFFNSRCDYYFIRDNYFITSEKNDNKPRYYTIRMATLDGVETIGEFQGYTTKRQAENAIKDMPKYYSLILELAITIFNSGLKKYWHKVCKLKKYQEAIKYFYSEDSGAAEFLKEYLKNN